jgi:sugar phosphate isomerase/epimerase
MPDMPVYMHVNYLENAFDTASIIARCADAGYDGIELRGEDETGRLPLLEYLQQTQQECQRRGLGLVYGCGTDAAHPDPAVRRRALDQLQTVIQFASDHGLPLLNVFGSSVKDPSRPASEYDAHGSACATPAQWQTTADHFRAAAEIAARKHVTLCLEVHHTYLHDLGSSTARLLDLISSPHVQANFDYGNIYIQRRQKGIAAELAALAGRVGYVHLKNACSLRQRFDLNVFLATPLRDGDINHVVLLRALRASGYRGVLTLENIMSGDKRMRVREDLAYLKDVLAETAAG